MPARNSRKTTRTASRKAVGRKTIGRKAPVRRGATAGRKTAGIRKVAGRTGGRGIKRTGSSTYPGILGMLFQDHEKVRKLLKRLENAEGYGREELFQEIYTEVMVHAKLEEEVFYPAFKQAVGTEKGRVLFYEAREEHASVEHLLEKMRGGDVATEEFLGQAMVLKEQIEHHAEEEEKEMFPQAKRVLGIPRLEELALRAQERKPELMEEIRGMEVTR
ncbi:MAG: hypothetical protein QOD77_1181 [Thermoplasmata archaeon]|jgi:hemerythrin-like domain-containing protein|nr:hypothetical protein [Thermoplasmata archaeon]